MALFKDKEKKKKPEVKMDVAPEGEESKKELEYMNRLNSDKQIIEEINYKEIPVCLSQEQINNMVIENNIMLKQIIAELD